MVVWFHTGLNIRLPVETDIATTTDEFYQLMFDLCR